MAPKVQKGGRTTSTTAKAASAPAKNTPEAPDPVEPVEGDADRLRREVEELRAATDEGVRFVGDTGHLWLEVPSIKTDRLGNVVGRDNGVFLDFGGYGITKPYHPDRSKADAEYVRRVDEWLESGAPEIERYSIRRLEAEEPKPPFARWRQMSASAIATAMSANLGDDNDANIEYVREAARFETEVGDDRTDVLAALDGLLATEAAGSDVFSAEVTLR